MKALVKDKPTDRAPWPTGLRLEDRPMPRDIGPDDVTVFWACGVTPQEVGLASKPPFMISHAPGHMFITDVRDEDMAVI